MSNIQVDTPPSSRKNKEMKYEVSLVMKMEYIVNGKEIAMK